VESKRKGDLLEGGKKSVSSRRGSEKSVFLGGKLHILSIAKDTFCGGRKGLFCRLQRRGGPTAPKKKRGGKQYREKETVCKAKTWESCGPKSAA